MESEGLRGVLQAADPWATDLLLSCLTAAAGSYRRSTCTAPFPSSLFEGADGTRDYAALLENLQTLPPAASLAAAAQVDRLSHQQAALLHWLLTHPRRPADGMRRCTLRQVQEQLPSLTGWVADIGMNPSLRPHAVLQLAPVPAPLLASVSGGSGRVLAFHGTSLENMHSILHNGLLNASGTRLERTGAAFGKGIYFSSELPVAFAFCQPADGWRPSALGGRLRCLLVCSIDRDHAQGAHNSDTIPDKYIVVERMDAVEMHFVFVYKDDGCHRPAAALCSPPLAASGGGAGIAGTAQRAPAGAAPQQRRSPLLYIMLLYVAWMVYVALRDHWPFLRRVLRRRFGVRF